MQEQEFFRVSLMKSEYTFTHSINTTGGMWEFHYHDFFEIFLSLTDGDEKNSNIFVNGKTYPIVKNLLFVFNHLDIHKVEIPKSVLYSRYIIRFNPEFINFLNTTETSLYHCFLNRNPNFCHCIKLDDLQAQELIKVIERGLNCYNRVFGASAYENNQYGSELLAKMALAEILISVNSVFFSAGMLYNMRHQNNPRIRAILEYIEVNLQNDLSVEKLAKCFYLNKVYLGAYFKKTTGSTVNQYITDRRIIKAKEMLKENKRTISEISETIGFKSVSRFIKTFKHLVGLTPKKYSVANRKYI